MKRWMVLFVFSMFLVWLPVQFVHADHGQIRLVLDGVEYRLDKPPIIENGRVLIPVRSIFTTLGAEMSWYESTRQVALLKGNTEIWLTIDGSRAKVNGVQFPLDVPPMIVNDSTYIPLRFVTQAFGYKVDWDGENQRVLMATSVEDESQVDIYGYYGFGSYASLLANPQRLSSVGFMWLTLHGDGSTVTNYPMGYKGAIDFCEGHEIKRDLVVFQDDPVQLGQLLTNRDHWVKVSDHLENIMSQDSFTGINLDLEGVPDVYREEFVDFVAYMHRWAKGQDKYFSLSLPAKTSSSQSWYKAYDYEQLAPYGDYFVIMAYDQHYAGGKAGPIAGLPWVEKVVQHSVSTLGSDKTILGCGIYGYDWPAEGRGRTVDYPTAQQLAIKKGTELFWDDLHYSPYLQYVDEQGGTRIVWFENEKSVAGKLSLVNKYELKGLALWRLGLIPGPVWQTLSGY